MTRLLIGHRATQLIPRTTPYIRLPFPCISLSPETYRKMEHPDKLPYPMSAYSSL